MNLKITGKNLLIEVLEDEQKGGVIIPDIAKQKSSFGLIHAFGEAVHKEHPEIVCGMRGLFRPFGTHQEIPLNGKTMLLVDLSYMLAVIE